jgi:hypothetical protein
MRQGIALCWFSQPSSPTSWPGPTPDGRAGLQQDLAGRDGDIVIIVLVLWATSIR